MISKILDTDSKVLFKRLFLVSIFFHLLAVFFSEGFHRPDEHLGMLRYVYVKLGIYPISELSWEYPAKIRNWVQPGFYYLISSFLYTVGIKNPFTITFFLRLVTSALSLGVFTIFIKQCSILVKDKVSLKVYYFFSFLFWFFPFIHARTTAENFGMTSLTIVLILLMKCLPRETFESARENFSYSLKNRSQVIPLHFAILIGFFLGMTVNFRIPLAPIVPATLCWLFLFGDTKISSLLNIILGGILSILFTTLIDTWGYEEFTYSTYSYLYQEFTRNVSTGFGTSPWYYYLNKVLMKGVPPISLFILIPTIYFWIKKKSHLFTWISLSIFLLHSLIGHKELRYIFPLVVFIPFFISYFISKFEIYIKNKNFLILFNVTIFVNFAFMTVSSLKPAYTPIDIYKFLYQNDYIDKLYTYDNLQRDKLRIYLKNNIPFEYIQGEEKFSEVLKENDRSWFLVEKIKDFDLFEKNDCKALYTTYPDWFTQKFKKYLQRSKAWNIYQCKS
tara:strand:+ start:97226 stop:98734 length:1509 start_codon:yes stop_codon:yes gene_type:complete